MSQHTDLTIIPIETPTLGNRSYLVHDGQVAFERTPIADGQTIEIGPRMRLTAIATPGHTFTHLSYALTDAAEVYPTHGFGSFCSATQSDATESTIGREKQANPALTQDEESYVRELLDGLCAFPAYYAHMPARNAAGPEAPDLSPPERADADQLRSRIEAGEWVVDLHNRTAFAAGHAPGTLNFGLDGGFATYLRWLITWGTPVTPGAPRTALSSPHHPPQSVRSTLEEGTDLP